MIPKVIPIDFYKTGSLFVTTSIASGGVQIKWRSKAFPRGLHFSKVGNIVFVYFCFLTLFFDPELISYLNLYLKGNIQFGALAMPTL